MVAPIRFGTAGIPLSTRGNTTVAGLGRVKELGLDHLELEFVHGVQMGEETAREVQQAARHLGLTLSVHGPYYINLNAVEPEKRAASIERVYRSAKVGAWCGAEAITFHPAFLLGMNALDVARNVEQALEEVLMRMQKEKIASRLKPETSGKPSQWGSLDDLLALHEKNPAFSPCIDFAHLHARSNGRFKTRGDVAAVFDQIEKSDSRLLKDLHAHMSGIEFSAKGEKNHLELDNPQNTFPWRLVLDNMKEFDVQGTVVSETPDIEKGALAMKNYWEEL